MTAEPSPRSSAAESPSTSAWQCLAQLYPTTDFDPGARGPIVFVVGGQFVMALPWDQGSGGTGFGQSGDGVTWSSDAILDPVQMDKLLGDVAVGPAGAVAVGAQNAGDGTAGAPAVWTSDDGAFWSLVAPSGVGGRVTLRRVAIHAKRVAVLAGITLYSADWGKPLAAAVLGGDARISDLAASATGFVAVGGDGKGAASWRSTDGRVWRRTSLDGASASGVVSSGSIVLASGTTGGDKAVRWRSADGGGTWVQEQGAAGPPDGARLFGMADGFVATGQPSGSGISVWTSRDGIAWSQQLIPASVLGDLPAADGWSAADNGSAVVLAARTPIGMTPGGVAICAAPLAAALAPQP